MQGTTRNSARGHWLGVILMAAAAYAAAEPSSFELADADLPQPVLKLSREITPARPDDGRRAVFITADNITGREDVETVAVGSVELRRAGSTLSADRLTYWPIEDEMDAVGNVRLTKEDDVMTGPHLRLRISDSIGYFEQPVYSIKRPANVMSPLDLPREPTVGSGEADRLDFEGEGHYRLSSATYSTCAPPNRDWYTKADEIRLDYDREVGEASNAKVIFKGMPILYSPWLSFSLNSQRKSGFLSPTFGSSTTRGLDFTLPWYWNIAPNMDATITPRLMTRRGVQFNGEFRYLDHRYSGQTRVEYLPKDHLTGTNRSAYSILHNHVLASNLSGLLNLNGASDATYFTDLSSRLSATSQANLIRQGVLAYSGGWWNSTLHALRYQTLQNPASPVGVPYYMLPQATLTAARPDLPGGLAFNLASEFVNFGHPTQVTGRRTMVYPQLSLPLLGPAIFVTPKVGLHATRYSLDRQDAGVPNQQSRQVPIFSVDSGMVMERNMEWQGRSLLQTLEPRLYYVRIPYRDQSQIPVFDSGVADFNFAQIFAENRYAGSDRIGDANQVTAVLVSRFIDPSTGAEIVRGAVGQRFYFNNQQVTLPSETARTNSKTDILAAVSGQVLPRTFADVGWQYSPSLNHSERFNAGVRWQPEINKVVNASYRFTRDQIRQVDFSAQWPIAGAWYGVARYNYSIRDRSLVEGLAGLEYDGGCWVARLVLHRIATQIGTTSSAIYFQLELNGLARIGSNPIDMLKRNIPGYGIINQPTADPIFGAY
jgi:LPS-assembly protein